MEIRSVAAMKTETNKLSRRLKGCTESFVSEQITFFILNDCDLVAELKKL